MMRCLCHIFHSCMMWFVFICWFYIFCEFFSWFKIFWMLWWCIVLWNWILWCCKLFNYGCNNFLMMWCYVFCFWLRCIIFYWCNMFNQMFWFVHLFYDLNIGWFASYYCIESIVLIGCVVDSSFETENRIKKKKKVQKKISFKTLIFLDFFF